MTPKKITSFVLKEYFFVFGLILFALIKIIEKNPVFIENYYHDFYFVYANSFSELVFGKLNFSFGDILYLLVPILVLTRIKKNNTRRMNLLAIGKLLFFTYLIFQVQWGLNYHRIDLYQKLSLSKTYSLASLEEKTKKIINNTNYLHKRLSFNDTLSVDVNYNKKFLEKETIESMKKVEFLNQPNIPKNIKNSLFSTINSYMGFSGYINPFTLEAQINKNTPMLYLPTTISHEIAHQLGYAAENEANFVGILSCIRSQNDFISYCGHVQALRYLLNELFRNNRESHKKISAELNSGVKKNIAEASKQINIYKNPFEPSFKKFYDYFLKINNQKEGIQSYNSVVSLLINYDRLVNNFR